MSEPVLMPFQSLPFNGDNYICNEFLKLKKQFGINTAIETGSCLYSTTKWLGDNFEKVYTVEINHDYAKHGYHKVENMPNVHAKIDSSVNWLNNLMSDVITKEDSCIFFLDAHWGDFCPLLGEIQAIAKIRSEFPPVITIHDFYTGNPSLGYDKYKGHPFNYDFIKPSLDMVQSALNCEYEYYFNTESEGARRGIIYLTPKQKDIELL